MPILAELIQDSGLTLSELHRRSGVSRTTLSRIVNGHQAMSRPTARKLAPTLDTSAEELIQPPPTRPAGPEILRISALEIRQWGETRQAEAELPELVCRLIRSELAAAGSIRAPSDERIVEPGPDITVDAPRATRHIPQGPSVWEVSSAGEVREKAMNDLNRHRVPAGWQCDETSWVFVTTASWAGKDAWALQQQAKHPWRSIRVFEATDLKTWIDESLAVQLWLMDRMGRNRSGFQWLPVAVRDWCSAADPPLNVTLLGSSVDKHFTAWLEWSRSGRDTPLRINGESRGETLLFLQALIERGGSDLLGTPIEGLCVDTEEALRQLLESAPDDVVVIPADGSVRELAVAHRGRIHVVLLYTGQPRSSDSLSVIPAEQRAVRDFLVGEGVDSGRATQLAQASAGSVSVLRRLTHKDGAWTSSPQVTNRQAQVLAAAGLFGIWDAGSKADRKLALRLTGQQRDEDVDGAWTELLKLPETPVWMDGDRRGVNSRLDTWQRFAEGELTPQAIDRFFDAVATALQQAPLDRLGLRPMLPEEYQGLRDSQISAELLRGLAKGLVLLAEFGERIDSRLVGSRVSERVEEVVFVALEGMTVDRLRALSEVMPLLAESAPEAFLEAMETDLERTDSAQKKLLNFRGDSRESEHPPELLHSTDALRYRSTLMWAYETLAWFPEYAERAIALLGQLANENVLDHHGGQPRQSLAKLLKPWNRGSVLDSERHCAVLRKLAENHSEWAFDLACDCLPLDYDTADHANLPLWRGRSDGADTVQSEEHRTAVHRTAVDILVQYATKSERTIYAALEVVENLPEAEAARVWKSVAAWGAAESRSEEERTRLVRHVTAFAEGAIMQHSREQDRESARRVLKELEVFPVIAPDLWLFKGDAAIREKRPEDAGWEVTDDRLERKRRSALRRVRESGGIEAILSLVSEVMNTVLLGAIASHVLPRDDINAAVMQALQAGGDEARSPMRWFIQGLLEGMDDQDAETLENVVRSSECAERNSNWLPCLIARFPFEVGTARANGLSREELIHYWQQFDSDGPVIPPERKDWLIAGLCSAKRPQAALWALRGNFKGARTESLRQLIHTLPQSKEENSGNVDYLLKRLVAAIRDRPDLSSAEAANIEFMCFDILKPDDMPALARAVANDPTWFQEALMLCTVRRDHAKDPPEWQERRENAPEQLKRRAFRIFEWLPKLPGTTSSGYKVERGVAWVKAILSFADEHDRREAAETLVGHALGSAGFHKDGSPTEELTWLLERIPCSRIERGIAVTVANQMGPVLLPADDAGQPYRTRAEFYRELEKRYRDSAPRTARVMRLLQRHFDNRCRWTDNQRRLDAHLEVQG